MTTPEYYRKAPFDFLCHSFRCTLCYPLVTDRIIHVYSSNPYSLFQFVMQLKKYRVSASIALGLSLCKLRWHTYHFEVCLSVDMKCYTVDNRYCVVLCAVVRFLVGLVLAESSSDLGNPLSDWLEETPNSLAPARAPSLEKVVVDDGRGFLDWLQMCLYGLLLMHLNASKAGRDG